MQRAWFFRIPLCVLVGILLAPPAQATVMVYMNTKELTEKASAVVRGQVVRQQVVQVDGHLWTDSRVRVIESLKGKLPGGQMVTVRQPGGETKRIGERVAGAARFSIGEEVMVFLRPVQGFYVPVGMCLGKFSIVRSNGKTDARRDLGGVAFGMFDLSGRFRVLESHHHQSKADSRSLAALKAKVVQIVKGGVR